MLASLAAAVLAALCYGVASVMQAVAVRAESRHGQARGGAGNIDLGLLPRLLGQWRFVASVLLDLLGFIVQVIALQKLPLFAVQAIVAANLAVIAVLAALVFAETPKPREWLAVAGVVAGVALLGALTALTIVDADAASTMVPRHLRYVDPEDEEEEEEDDVAIIEHT